MLRRALATLAFNHEEITARPLKPALLELDGISRQTVEAHYKLYDGYVNKRNEIMGPDGGGEPSGRLADAINDLWGGLDELKKAMNDNGVKRFGSGWTWLVHDGTGLALYSTPNQDSPLLNDDFAILGIDVWEHAYYLKYQNRRPDYLEAWWNVVNWDAVAKNFDRAVAELGAPAT